MGYECKILLDSISETGKRLTTFQVTFPRIILAEFNTHRMFSRNSASSRAIPFEKQLNRVIEDPFVPEQFPLNCKGMQPQEYITKDSPEYEFVIQEWLIARNGAITQARQLYDLNIHKQIVNRLLEPFMWHTVIITATEFDNFFKLRCDTNAQYEIKRIADLMYYAYYSNLKAYKISGNLSNSPVQKLEIGEWHCPLISEEDDELVKLYIQKPLIEKVVVYPENIEYINIKKMISVARCARVSYLTHEGKRDIEKDLELCLRLRESGHWSPFEHVATPSFQCIERDYLHQKNIYEDLRSGNFVGWKQFRKEFQDENCVSFRKEN